MQPKNLDPGPLGVHSRKYLHAGIKPYLRIKYAKQLKTGISISIGPRANHPAGVQCPALRDAVAYLRPCAARHT